MVQSWMDRAVSVVFESYVLAANPAVTNPQSFPTTPPTVNGGNYIWRAIAGNWASATATLQVLDLDGSTWVTAKDASGADATLTSSGNKTIPVGQGSKMRVNITGGNPTTFYSSLMGIS